MSCKFVVRRGVHSPTHLKSQFLPEMTLLKPQQNFQICLKSNFLLSRIYTSKCFQDDWSQVNNMQSFTDRHLLMVIN